MSIQCYKNKAAAMPTREVLERREHLINTYGGGDSEAARVIADATVRSKIEALELELTKRNIL